MICSDKAVKQLLQLDGIHGLSLRSSPLSLSLSSYPYSPLSHVHLRPNLSHRYHDSFSLRLDSTIPLPSIPSFTKLSATLQMYTTENSSSHTSTQSLTSFKLELLLIPSTNQVLNPLTISPIRTSGKLGRSPNLSLREYEERRGRSTSH